MPLWKWILCLLAGFLIFTVLYGLATGLSMDIDNPWLSMASFLGSGILGLFLYAVWTNLTEHRPVTELAMKSMAWDTVRGLLFGIGFFAVVAGVLALTGSYRITEAHFHAVPLLLAFFQFFTVAVFEEILFRGILFRLIDDRWNTAVALLISALLFGFIHIINPGATLWSSLAIAIEAGLLLGAAYKCSGTLWAPIGIHWAWNFVQGNVLGFSVSGNPVQDKVFSAIISGPDWLTGGRFGAEACVPAVVVGLILSIIILCCCKRDER